MPCAQAVGICRRLGVTICAALALAACSGGGHRSESDTTTTERSVVVVCPKLTVETFVNNGNQPLKESLACP
jgi:hypothetical protein